MWHAALLVVFSFGLIETQSYIAHYQVGRSFVDRNTTDAQQMHLHDTPRATTLPFVQHIPESEKSSTFVVNRDPCAAHIKEGIPAAAPDKSAIVSLHEHLAALTPLMLLIVVALVRTALKRASHLSPRCSDPPSLPPPILAAALR